MYRDLRGFAKYLNNSKKELKTICAYINDVRFYLDHLKSNNLQLEKTNKNTIDDYKSNLLNYEKMKISTINRKLVAIKHFYKYKMIEIIVEGEKEQKVYILDKILANEEVGLMSLEMDKAKDARAKALLMTLKFTGMRVSEMLQFNKNDINASQINVLGKGNKHRIVLIPDKLKKFLGEYNRIRKDNSDKFFTGQRGAINRQTVHRILKKYAKLSNVEADKVHCHAFRHKFALDLVRNGVSIDTIADILGHSDINTTRLYTRKTKQQLLNIINESL